MAQWQQLELKLGDISSAATQQQIRDSIKARVPVNDYWIAEVDQLGVRYAVYESIEIMARETWADWPAYELDDFRDEHTVLNGTVQAEHARQYYLLANAAVTDEFMAESLKAIASNIVD